MRRRDRHMPLVKYADPLSDTQTSRIPSRLFTCLVWGLFFVCSAGAALFYLMTRPIVITSANVSDQALFDLDYTVPLSLNGLSPSGNVSFMVPEGTSASDIVTENLYNERKFLVHISMTGDSFYGRMTESGVPLDMGKVYGDESYVKSVGVTYDRSGALLVFEMNRVSEYILTMDENRVVMEVVRPQDMYDYVVVADPGSDEAAGVCTDVSERLAVLAKDKNIKVYITDRERGEETVSPQELMSETDADIYIGIGVSHDGSGHHGIVTWYDPLYYIPGYGSTELSDSVLKNVAISTSNRALAVNAAPYGDTLYGINAPATYVTIGNADNSGEFDLLREDQYRDRIAKGLFDAVLEAYSAMNEAG